MATSKSTRRKASTKAVEGQPEQPPVQLLDFGSKRAIRVLDPSAVFFIEMPTGNIVPVAKDRVSNAFRRAGNDIVFFDRGADAPPADSSEYVTIEEVEDITEVIEDTDREAAKAAQHEDEHRAGEGTGPTAKGQGNKTLERE